MHSPEVVVHLCRRWAHVHWVEIQHENPAKLIFFHLNFQCAQEALRFIGGRGSKMEKVIQWFLCGYN